MAYQLTYGLKNRGHGSVTRCELTSLAGTWTRQHVASVAMYSYQCRTLYICTV